MCARIGAVYSMVFAGFSSIALVARINDASCKIVLITASAIYGNQKRYKNVYFLAYKAMCFLGDGALRDSQGNFRITVESMWL